MTAAWTLAALALALGSEATPLLPEEPSAIVGGDVAAECQFPSVVSMLWNHSSTLCSGTMIHPQVVLTAAHCVTAEVEIDSVAFGEATATAGGTPELVVDTIACVPHPGWLAQQTHDVAYCILEHPVSVPLVPLAAGCELQALQPGQEVVIVGFGATFGAVDDEGEVIDTEGVGTKRFTTQVIDHIDETVGAVYLAGPDGSQSACFGDSGGPGLVRMTDATWRTFGAASQLFDPGGLPPPMLPGNVCGPGASYGHAGLVVEWLEASSGFDLTPCWNGDVFTPGPGCIDFPQQVHQAHGTWAGGCFGGNELHTTGVCDAWAGPFDPNASEPPPPEPEPPVPEPEPEPPMPPPPMPPMPPPPMPPDPGIDPRTGDSGSDDGETDTDTDPALEGDGFVGRGCTQGGEPRSAWMLAGALALLLRRRRA